MPGGRSTQEVCYRVRSSLPAKARASRGRRTDPAGGLTPLWSSRPHGESNRPTGTRLPGLRIRRSRRCCASTSLRVSRMQATLSAACTCRSDARSQKAERGLSAKLGGEPDSRRLRCCHASFTASVSPRLRRTPPSHARVLVDRGRADSLFASSCSVRAGRPHPATRHRFPRRRDERESTSRHASYAATQLDAAVFNDVCGTTIASRRRAPERRTCRPPRGPRRDDCRSEGDGVRRPQLARAGSRPQPRDRSRSANGSRGTARATLPSPAS